MDIKGKAKVLKDIPELGYKKDDVIEHYGYDSGGSERCKGLLVYPKGTEWQRINVEAGGSGYAVLLCQEYTVLSMVKEKDT